MFEKKKRTKKTEFVEKYLPSQDAEEEAAEEEELEIYQPKGTNDDIYQIDEEDTDSGVNINFDD